MFVKSAIVWMHNIINNLSMLKWSDLKNSLQEYFRPVDFYRRAHDKSANCKQTGHVMGYIDKIKHIA